MGEATGVGDGVASVLTPATSGDGLGAAEPVGLGEVAGVAAGDGSLLAAGVGLGLAVAAAAGAACVSLRPSVVLRPVTAKAVQVILSSVV